MEVAQILAACEVPFQYEHPDQNGRRTDFYFPEADRYLEVHSERFGPKIMPDNGYLVNSLSRSRAAALSTAFLLRPEPTKAYIANLSDRACIGLERSILDLAVYLRGEIEEQRTR